MNIYIRISLLSFVLLIASMNAQSTISQSSMNLRDLNTMVQFIEQHQKIADTLMRIDFMNYTIIFDNGCEAYFERIKPSFFSFPKPDAQQKIEFKSSTCSLTYDAKEQNK